MFYPQKSYRRSDNSDIEEKEGRPMGALGVGFEARLVNGYLFRLLFFRFGHFDRKHTILLLKTGFWQNRYAGGVESNISRKRRANSRMTTGFITNPRMPNADAASSVILSL
jgi:hypothetical protein